MINLGYIKKHKDWWMQIFMIVLCLCVLLCSQDVRADDLSAEELNNMEITVVCLPQGYGKVDLYNMGTNSVPQGYGSSGSIFYSELSNTNGNIVAFMYDKYSLKFNELKLYCERGGSVAATTADKTIDGYTYHTATVTKAALKQFIDANKGFQGKHLTFYFVARASSDKDIGGSVITNAFPNAWGSTAGDKVASKVEQTTITASPASDEYEFDHWEKNGYYFSNHKSETVNVQGAMDVYTAYFKKANNYGVSVATNDSNLGTVSGGSMRNVNGTKVNTTTISAHVVGTNNKFDHWELETDGVYMGAVGKDANMQVDVRDKKDVYTAIFVDNNFDVKAVVSPEVGGTASVVESGDPKTVTISVTKNNGYKIDHWELTRNGEKKGRVRGSEDTYTFTKNEADETYTIYMVDESKNGVFTTTAPSEAGTAVGDRTYDANIPNATTTLTATPSSTDWKFDHWELDGKKVSETSPYTVSVKNEYDLYTAYFARQDKDTGVYTQVSPSGAGTTSGDVKRNINGNKTTQTTIQAYPATSDWVFDHWELSSSGKLAPEDVGKANPYTVNVTDYIDTYTAVFRNKNGTINPDVSITAEKTGITDEKYLNKWRSFTTPGNQFSRVAFKQEAHNFVANLGGKYVDTPASIGVPYAVVGLKEKLSTVENESSQDVLTLLSSGSKLISSDAEELSFTQVDSIVQYQETAETYVKNKWGSQYTYTFIESAKVDTPEGFIDGLRTLLWSDTGAAYKDNLFIILEAPGKQTEFVTPVADYDGVLTFTVPSVVDTRMILGKAYIK